MATKTSGPPEQGPNGLMPATAIVWRRDCRGERLPIAALIAPIAVRQRIREHAIPMALAAGGAV